MTENILEIRSLNARYGSVEVLRNIELAVPAGQVSAIIGANGAGKTTLLRAISSMCVTSGEIRFDGARIDSLNTNRIARLGIAHVPDGRGTLTGLSVDDNLRVGGITNRNARVKAADIEKIYSYFPKLRERHMQQAGTLSGGEQQMLAIGRALMQRPRLLMLDEPSFGLAPLIVKEIFRIVDDINRTEGISIILVEQNVQKALLHSSKAFLIETGEIKSAGASSAFLENDDIKKSYLGS